MNWRKTESRARISTIVEGWSVAEPLLFAAWTMHDVQSSASVETIRVGHGRIEYNPEFIASLKRNDLSEVLSFEAMRILLAHPYHRRQPSAAIAYQASNLAIQECLHSSLPIERAREVLKDDSFDDQTFEVYYHELINRSRDDVTESDEPNKQNDDSSTGPSPRDEQATDEPSENDSASEDDTTQEQRPATLEDHLSNQLVGATNAAPWDSDDLMRDEITAAVKEAAAADGWGSLPGAARERLIATLRPSLDYRTILRRFRQTVLSINRRLTRMKPSRRYELNQLGSRYDFTTRLLVAIDVSGSMSSEDAARGLALVNQFFRVGVRSIDVIVFDTEIRGPVATLRSARRFLEIQGRGGTDLGTVMRFLDEHRDYDGVIVVTDGVAPVPPPPKQRRTRILWLFIDEASYRAMADKLKPLGSAAYLRPSRDRRGEVGQHSGPPTHRLH